MPGRRGSWGPGRPRPSRLPPSGWEGPPRTDLVGTPMRFIRNGMNYHPRLDLTGLAGLVIAAHPDSRVTLRFEQIQIDTWDEEGNPLRVPLEVDTHLYNLAHV